VGNGEKQRNSLQRGTTTAEHVRRVNKLVRKGIYNLVETTSPEKNQKARNEGKQEKEGGRQCFGKLGEKNAAEIRVETAAVPGIIAGDTPNHFWEGFKQVVLSSNQGRGGQKP